MEAKSPIGKSADFKLEPGKVPVLFIEPFAPAFAQAVARLEQDPGIQVVECGSTLDAASLARRVGICVIVGFAGRDEDATRLLTLQKLVGQQISRKAVRLLFTSSVRDKDVIFRMTTQLDAEVLPEPVTEKSLLFKIDRLIKALPVVQVAEDARGAESLKKAEQAGLPQLVPSEALAIESDCWLTIPGGAKVIGGRWVVKLRGPSPAHGSWLPIESAEAGLPAWQWRPTDEEKDPFIREQGAWVYYGQKPEFQGGAWTFVGKKLSLSFYYEAESYGSKFETDSTGNLRLAADSEGGRRAARELERLEKLEKAERARAAAGGETETAPPAQPNPLFAQGVTIEAPLELDSDCWLLENQKPRRVANKWMVSLLGPPGHTGKWVPIEEEGGSKSRGAGADRYWQWIPVDPDNDPFIQEQGAWVFYGMMPKFVDNLWSFVGENPELAFYYDGQSYGAKLQARSLGTLTLARDSDAARRKRPLIEQAIDRVLAAKADPARPLTSAPMDVRIPQRQFGADGGEWEAATVGSQMRRWFVYIPVEVLTVEGTDIRKLPVYWIFLGAAPPKASGAGEEKTWLFQDRKPQSFESFAALPEPIRKFLTQYFGGAGVAQTPEEQEGLFVVRSKGPESAPPVPSAESKSFSFPLERFGKEGGEWEAVSVGSGQRRWYVYVPAEVLAGGIANIRKLPVYWVYFGSVAPRQSVSDSGREMVFQERKPQQYTAFSDLQRPVQDFFLQYFGEKAAAEASSGASARAGAGAAAATAPADEYGLKLIRHEEGSPQRREGGYRLSEEEIGTAGGEWEMTGTGSEGRRWFIYVSAELLAGAADARKLPRYWVYFGARAPRRIAEDSGSFWHFEERPPQAVLKFQDLQRAVQEFLMEYFQRHVKAETERGAPKLRAEAPARPAFGSPSAPSGMFVAEIDDSETPGPVGRAPEGAEPRASAPIEPAAIEPAAMESMPMAPAPIEPEPVPGQEVAAAAERVLDMRPAHPETPRGTGEVLNYQNLRPAKGAAARAGAPELIQAEEIEAEQEPAGIPRLLAPETLTPEAAGPAAVRAMLPPGPSLGPLAVALLMSELVRKRELERKQVARRFCQYMSASFGGLHVELWARAGASWYCAGGSDGPEGAFLGIFCGVGTDLEAGPQGAAYVAPIRTAAGTVLGAIAVGAGASLERMPTAYVAQVARVCLGLLLALGEPDGPLGASPQSQSA
ncbi:MAG: hypothetical protein NDJ89_15665 [Oligoflexia bacterium]|nr:hypothetical protein [Oligoflexia bacterium]